MNSFWYLFLREVALLDCFWNTYFNPNSKIIIFNNSYSFSFIKVTKLITLLFKIITSQFSFGPAPDEVATSHVLWLKSDSGTIFVSGNLTNWSNQASGLIKSLTNTIKGISNVNCLFESVLKAQNTRNL